MPELKQAETLTEAYRQLFNVAEDDELVIVSIRGRRNEACSRDCPGCPNYPDVCFPNPTYNQRTAWHRLMNKLFRGGNE
jgi:hypothetical protein